MNSFVDEFVKMVEAYIKTDDIKTIYDIGAGDCDETKALRESFPQAEIIAFECNPACIFDCAKSIVNLDRITFVPICVNDATGLVKFHPINQEKTITQHPDGNPRASSLYLSNGTYPNETYVQDEIVLPCMTIEDMMESFGLPSPEILWMDLQGAELPALKGMGDLSSVEIVHTEVTSRAMYEGQCLYPETRKHLEDNGFVCVTDMSRFPDNWRQLDLDFVREDMI